MDDAGKENQKDFCGEMLALSVAASLLHGMVHARLTRDGLAKVVGLSRETIDAWIADPLEMTLPQLGDLLWACGLEVHDLSLALIPKVQEEPSNG